MNNFKGITGQCIRNNDTLIPECLDAGLHRRELGTAVATRTHTETCGSGGPVAWLCGYLCQSRWYDRGSQGSSRGVATAVWLMFGTVLPVGKMYECCMVTLDRLTKD